jgi:hypothetical protein
MRIRGEPIVEIAHEFGLSIEAAKHLITETHNAIAEDLKANLEQNRALDLARIDRLRTTAAKGGAEKAAQITLNAFSAAPIRQATATGRMDRVGASGPS